MFFENRKDAGERLVSLMAKYKQSPDTIVLGLPRGGVVVALEVALGLELPMDVWVTRKLGAPLNPELAIGSVDADGNVYLDENTTMLYEVSERFIRDEAREQIAEIGRRYQEYRGSEEAPDIAGKTVLMVDDGVATGYTMIAALKSARNRGVQRLVCVIPVASPRVITKLEELADEVICLSTPSYFGAVGEFYRNFAQVSDDEVLACLAAAKQAS